MAFAVSRLVLPRPTASVQSIAFVPTCRKGRKRNPKSTPRIPRRANSSLMREFEEDVKKPLQPSSGSTRKDAVTIAGFKIPKIPKLEPPKTREQTLELLVRGAWFGIGTLTLVFFLVHFVIVKDLLPNKGG